MYLFFLKQEFIELKFDPFFLDTEDNVYAYKN